MHNISENLFDKKIQSFISYCMFADKDYILNGNAYWRDVNLVVLEKVYIDTTGEETVDSLPEFLYDIAEINTGIGVTNNGSISA